MHVTGATAGAAGDDAVEAVTKIKEAAKGLNEDGGGAAHTEIGIVATATTANYTIRLFAPRG
jgi:hypothetical protein